MAKKCLLIVAAVGFVLSLGAVAEAQRCFDNVFPLRCNGQWDIISAAGLGDEASLMRIVVTDPLPINIFPQNVSVRVCDIGTLNDRYSAEVFRLAAPVDIQRCRTPIGGGCTTAPIPRSALAASDVLFFIIHVVQEDLNGTGIANARFHVLAPGWGTLDVRVLDNTPNAVVELPSGPGCP